MTPELVLAIIFAILFFIACVILEYNSDEGVGGLTLYLLLIIPFIFFLVGTPKKRDDYSKFHKVWKIGHEMLKLLK